MYEKLCFFILAICAVEGIPSNILKLKCDIEMSEKLETCYADNNNPYPFTGVKTAYDFVHSNITKRIVLENCKPQQIWMLVRHGTRYPNEKGINQMLNLTHFRDFVISNHENHKRGHLCEKDLENLKNWKPDPGLHPNRAKGLSSQGKKDLEMLGQRLKKEFPQLFGTCESHHCKFRSTDTQRTVDSMNSFVKGAFSSTFTPNPEIVPSVNDTLLKIYDNCKPWEEMKVTQEMTKWINGPTMTEVLANVSERLGLTYKLNFDDAFLIYDACRYQRAWYPEQRSPWCAAFTDDDIRVLEYEEDLYHYYRVGPGVSVNSELGCHPLRDMLDRFSKLEDATEEEPAGVFYFTHSEMVMLFYAAMSIGKDTPPITASNYREMGNRRWRSSLLTPFATNFAAVFYKCENSLIPFKVAFYLAEEPLNLEGCVHGICDWQRLKKKLAPIAAKCSTKFCEKK
ncbi:multiple inositol polyphosphate phosphatase 1 isoform X1 [Linepithema humile]|uniref:multiple inositol polyphosphate phosphatase 1 isoform X1 n=2 Tax=Linepithema humile TaxID=83485 RepID=UPI00351F5E1F